MLRRTLVLRCIIEPAKFYWTATYAYLQQLFFGKKIFLTTFNIFYEVHVITKVYRLFIVAAFAYRSTSE